MSAGSKTTAKFVTQDKKDIPVHFNPASLQFSIVNTLGHKRNSTQQHVDESKVQLSMELVFDTTDSHTTDSKQNVCIKTEEIAKLMRPVKKKVPPVVTFDWGDFTFTGIIDSYKETIDYFSPDGVPLRCTVNLSMSRLDNVFDSRAETRNDEPRRGDGSGGGGGAGAGAGTGAGGGAGGLGSGGSGGGPGDIVDTGRRTDQSMTSVASQGGDPNAGRALAASNGEESIRFPRNASLSIDTSIPLGPPVAFASGGAGFSLEAGFSAGAQAGAGLGISGGPGVGIGAGLAGGVGFSAISGSAGVVSGPIAGGSASAGVSASQGAFAHLRAPSLPDRPARLQGHRYTHRTETLGYATGSRATFQLGGMATTDSATVEGGTTTLRGRIRFGET